MGRLVLQCCFKWKAVECNSETIKSQNKGKNHDKIMELKKAYLRPLLRSQLREKSYEITLEEDEHL